SEDLIRLGFEFDRHPSQAQFPAVSVENVLAKNVQHHRSFPGGKTIPALLRTTRSSTEPRLVQTRQEDAKARHREPQTLYRLDLWPSPHASRRGSNRGVIWPSTGSGPSVRRPLNSLHR